MAFSKSTHKGLTPELVMEKGEQIREALLASLTPEERLRGLGPEERMSGLASEERISGLEPDELLILLERIEEYLREHNIERKK